MKIIWITPECPYPPDTGGRIGIWKRIEYMSEKNDIYLFSIIDDEKERSFSSDMLKVCKQVSLYQRNRRIRILIHSVVKPYSAVSRWNAQMKEDISKACQEYLPDLIMVDFPQMLGVLSKEILESHKVVLNQHNIEHLAMRNIANSLNDPLKKIIYNYVAYQLEKYEDKIYERDYIDLYTFVSISDKSYFEKKYKNTNTYLFAVGTEIRELPDDNENHNITFIGKMSYPPNVDGVTWFLKNVWNKVRKEFPDAKFYIVGKDPSKELYEFAKGYDSVVITGTVNSVETYYKESQLIVIPLLSGGGVKVKLLEALGYGKAVVSTNKGIEGTTFKHTEHLLVADDAHLFAQYCCDVLQNVEGIAKMRKRSIMHIEEFYSWKSIVQKFEDKLLGIKYWHSS